ncbi:MAG: hypothetical protein ACOC1K_02320 [Nanoarchaeota archaeon]
MHEQELSLDWTHKGVEITDIRKLSKLYAITIDSEDINTPLFIKDLILEGRVKSFFLKDIYQLNRAELLSQRWNFFITKGYYIKIKDGEVIEFEGDPEKNYVSFLEIDGPLGRFESVYKEEIK